MRELTSALRHVGFGVVDEYGEPAQLAPVKPRVVRSTQPATPQAITPRARKATTRPQTAAAAKRRRTELRTRTDQAGREYAAAEAARRTDWSWSGPETS
ncbi:hypothetical protein ACWGID_07585 [Kribbella sp. NPDC054772]